MSTRATICSRSCSSAARCRLNTPAPAPMIANLTLLLLRTKFKSVAEGVKGIETVPSRFRYRRPDPHARLEKLFAKCVQMMDKESNVPTLLRSEGAHRPEMDLLGAIRAGLIPYSAPFMFTQ